MSTSKLFQPVKVGSQTLQHRIVLAPLTRFRSTPKGHVPVNPLMKTYYAQRSIRPGSLLITEATFISPQAGGYDWVPGIWNEEQINAWKEVST
jgi:NADPH2 dehydrogenase